MIPGRQSNVPVRPRFLRSELFQLLDNDLLYISDKYFNIEYQGVSSTVKVHRKSTKLARKCQNAPEIAVSLSVSRSETVGFASGALRKALKKSLN